ncbi:unnamed protein product [Rotaria socialis]|uniref:Dynamin GTPase domain-containing protein n=1 Tax=Rotaria socialis TaxID=392032 RepID=A0A820NW29_9BILA|nr:unnamed protein product [Rotaria socialis]CAF3487945.1 unnamed protein product [Rotaria socialis]CAF4125402.1 unnamed protein product [Rotaria socialis]CAF4398436.1 unnamed protein product [Rotaria socialis]
MDTFVHTYDEKIRPLMDKIDQARSLLPSNDEGIIFPSIVVVGDQSSGKSTLIESLSLVELPKGSEDRIVWTGITKLYSTKKNANILKYIEEETKNVAGNNRNIVKNSIEIQVDDPSVQDLTVVDLPSIARNPIDDQRKEDSIILRVSPANVDIGTVESFTIAREIDPEGERTIGVITKSDLAANNDTLIQQLLMDRPDVLHLTLGFIVVRNRSTDENISLEDARNRVKEFFNQHHASSVTSHCLGIDALINRLADLYSDRVKKTFPKMRTDVQNKLKDICEQLSKFPQIYNRALLDELNILN